MATSACVARGRIACNRAAAEEPRKSPWKSPEKSPESPPSLTSSSDAGAHERQEEARDGEHEHRGSVHASCVRISNMTSSTRSIAAACSAEMALVAAVCRSTTARRP